MVRTHPARLRLCRVRADFMRPGGAGYVAPTARAGGHRRRRVIAAEGEPDRQSELHACPTQPLGGTCPPVGLVPSEL